MEFTCLHTDCALLWCAVVYVYATRNVIHIKHIYLLLLNILYMHVYVCVCFGTFSIYFSLRPGFSSFISICFNSSYMPSHFNSRQLLTKMRTHNGQLILVFPFCHFQFINTIQRLYFHISLFPIQFFIRNQSRSVSGRQFSLCFPAYSIKTRGRQKSNTRFYIPLAFSDNSSKNSNNNNAIFSPINGLNKGDRIQCYSK